MTRRLLSGCSRRRKGRGRYNFGTGAEAPLPTPDGVYIVTQPSGAETGVPFTTQPVLQLTDGGVDLRRGGFVCIAALASGSGTLGEMTPGDPTPTAFEAISRINGRFVFDDLLVDGSGNHTLGFTGSGLTFPDTAVFNVIVPSVETQLGITTQPGSATIDTVFDVQPVIQLLDGSGTDVAQSGITVTAAIATGSGVLTTTLTANTDTNGTATFTNLEIDNASDHSLIFTASGLTSVTSIVFGVGIAPAPNPGTIVDLNFNDGTSLATLGVNFANQFLRSGGQEVIPLVPIGTLPYRKHKFHATAGVGGSGAIQMTWNTGMGIGFSPVWIRIPGGFVPHFEFEYTWKQTASMVHPGSAIKFMRTQVFTPYGGQYALGMLEYDTWGAGERFKWHYDWFVPPTGSGASSKLLCAFDYDNTAAGCTPKITDLADGNFHTLKIECDYSDFEASTVTVWIDDTLISKNPQTIPPLSLSHKHLNLGRPNWAPAIGNAFNISPFVEMYSCGPTGCQANINSGVATFDNFTFTVLP